MPPPRLTERITPPGGKTGISALDQHEHAISDCDTNGEIERCCDDLWNRDCNVRNIETRCEQLLQLTALVRPRPRHVIVPTARIHKIICVEGEHNTKEPV